RPARCDDDGANRDPAAGLQPGGPGPRLGAGGRHGPLRGARLLRLPAALPPLRGAPAVGRAFTSAVPEAPGRVEACGGIGGWGRWWEGSRAVVWARAEWCEGQRAVVRARGYSSRRADNKSRLMVFDY